MKKIISFFFIMTITLSGVSTYTMASTKENLDIECERCAKYKFHVVEEKGVYYIEYSNPTTHEFQLNYQLTKKDGSVEESHIKVKKGKDDKVKIGKGSDLKITGNIALDKNFNPYELMY